jgi:hypothetical protein
MNYTNYAKLSKSVQFDSSLHLTHFCYDPG